MSGFVAPFKNGVQENSVEPRDDDKLSNSSDFSGARVRALQEFSPFESCLQTLLGAKPQVSPVKISELVNAGENNMSDSDTCSISLKINSSDESDIETKKNNKRKSGKKPGQKVKNKTITKHKGKSSKQKTKDSQKVSKEDEASSQEKSCSQTSTFSSVFGKMVLSQAPKNFTHRQRLEWLQERRQVGLWVQCSLPDCMKWRYLAHIHDPTMLPEVWCCNMNPDVKANTCSKKEQKLKIKQEEDCIHAQYNAGSLVWAQLPGYPWWPAMVDDDPDTAQYYWLDGFSDIPTDYHVTFFDSKEVSRAWLSSEKLKPFALEGKYVPMAQKKIQNDLKWQLNYDINEAKHAIKMTIIERLKKYSFLSRYKGPIATPNSKNVTKYKNESDAVSLSESMLCIDDLIQEVSESEAGFGEIYSKSQEIKKNPIIKVVRCDLENEKKNEIENTENSSCMVEESPENTYNRDVVLTSEKDLNLQYESNYSAHFNERSQSPSY